MGTLDSDRLGVLVRRAIKSLAICRNCLDQIEGDPGTPTGRIANVLGSQLQDPASLFHRPLVDTAAMTVTWAGRTCHISSAILIGIIERLARRPNHYVPFERLLKDVWNGTRSDLTIRSSIR